MTSCGVMLAPHAVVPGNILVVEDEQIVAMDICRTLLDRGYSVNTASSSDEALRSVASHPPDLVLMDIKLDGVDGIETAGQIQKELDVAIVYLTAYSDDATIARARITEPYAYLIKPFDYHELYATVELALQRHAHDRRRRQQAHTEDFLVEASARLAESLDSDAVIARAAELLVPRHADSCLYWLQPSDKTARNAYVYPEGVRLRGSGTAMSMMLDSAKTWTAEVPDGARLADLVGQEYAEHLARHGLAVSSLLCVPLDTRAPALGALLLVLAAPRVFHGAEIAGLEDFVRRFGMAIENALLDRASREAAREREQIAAIVSHDLRGLLQALLLRTELLDRGGDNDRMIVRTTRQMARLIEDLLDATAIDAGQLAIARAPHDGSELVHKALEVVYPLAAEKTLALHVVPPVQPVIVSCDPDRIIQVLTSVLGHAISRAPPGTAIDIRIAGDGTMAHFDVTDTGQDIGVEELVHTFERYRKPRSAESTELGLYISRRLVEGHGGAIRAKSTPGSGTTISFTLPIAAAPVRASGG